MQSLDAEPQGLDAGLSVTLAGKEPAELRDQADDLTNGWWLPLVENIGVGPFGFGKEQFRRPVRMDSAQGDQSCQMPRHHQIDRQGQFQFGHASQFQSLHPTTILEHMKRCFDLPAAAIPVDQLDRRFKINGLGWSASATRPSCNLAADWFPCRRFIWFLIKNSNQSTEWFLLIS